MLIARGEQSRRAVAELADRLARLEDACLALIESPQGPSAASPDSFADRFERWAVRQAERQEEQASALRGIQETLGGLAESVRGVGVLRSADSAASPSRPRHGGPTTEGGSGKLYWEQTKRKLIEQLEDPHPPEGAGPRLRDADAGESTDRLASQDAEIADLRSQLEQASRTVQAVDLDPLVQEERQRLRKLQAEWEEKLRRSEIEISIERAKLARERTQLEERLRAVAVAPEGANELESDRAGGRPSDKATRGRWLARLGLLEDAE